MRHITTSLSLDHKKLGVELLFRVGVKENTGISKIENLMVKYTEQFGSSIGNYVITKSY